MTSKQIKKDLSVLGKRFDLILFGSVARGEERPESDIDIAVLSYTDKKEQIIKIQKEVLGLYPLKYDIRVFESFPIDVQINLIEDCVVLFGDELDISEYFYKFRKRWDDCKHRILENQFTSFRQIYRGN